MFCSADLIHHFHRRTNNSQHTAGRIPVRQITLLNGTQGFRRCRITRQNHQLTPLGKQFHYGLAGETVKHLDHILSVDPRIDTLVLGCTHYPLLIGKIRQYLPQGITVFAQGEYVADSLKDYLNRHPEMDCRLTRGGECRFLTTESAAKFSEAASVFLNDPIEVEQISID